VLFLKCYNIIYSFIPFIVKIFNMQMVPKMPTIIISIEVTDDNFITQNKYKAIFLIFVSTFCGQKTIQTCSIVFHENSYITR